MIVFVMFLCDDRASCVIGGSLEF